MNFIIKLDIYQSNLSVEMECNVNKCPTSHLKLSKWKCWNLTFFYSRTSWKRSRPKNSGPAPAKKALLMLRNSVFKF